MTKHLAHFGLTIAPFSKEVADHELWLPPSKVAVVHAVRLSSAQHSPTPFRNRDRRALDSGRDGSGSRKIGPSVAHRCMPPPATDLFGGSRAGFSAACGWDLEGA